MVVHDRPSLADHAIRRVEIGQQEAIGQIGVELCLMAIERAAVDRSQHVSEHLRDLAAKIASDCDEWAMITEFWADTPALAEAMAKHPDLLATWDAPMTTEGEF